MFCAFQALLYDVHSTRLTLEMMKLYFPMFIYSQFRMKILGELIFGMSSKINRGRWLAWEQVH